MAAGKREGFIPGTAALGADDDAEQPGRLGDHPPTAGAVVAPGTSRVSSPKWGAGGADVNEYRTVGIGPTASRMRRLLDLACVRRATRLAGMAGHRPAGHPAALRGRRRLSDAELSIMCFRGDRG